MLNRNHVEAMQSSITKINTIQIFKSGIDVEIDRNISILEITTETELCLWFTQRSVSKINTEINCRDGCRDQSRRFDTEINL